LLLLLNYNNRNVYKEFITTIINLKNTQNKTKMICEYCEYVWESRKETPKSCPRCKKRFDYPKTIKTKIILNKITEELRGLN